MNDVAGNELSIGDKVATMFDGHSNLKVVEVVGFTPKKVRVKRSNGDGTYELATKFPSQVCLAKKAEVAA